MRNHVSPLLFFRLFLLLTMNLCLVWLVLPAVASEARVERGHLDPYERAYIDRFLKSGEYLPVSDVKEGDTGYGLSVFHGMKVEKFDYTIDKVREVHKEELRKLNAQYRENLRQLVRDRDIYKGSGQA